MIAASNPGKLIESIAKDPVGSLAVFAGVFVLAIGVMVVYAVYFRDDG
ncbi:MAG TPA: hypothetical protein VF796_12320 [Humisphaera sp.]